MSAIVKAYIGVGTNLGDRIQNLIDARERLRSLPQVMKLSSSSFYVSSPVGYLDQANFVNCVYELTLSLESERDDDLASQAFFSQLQRIETSLGRVRDPENQNAARTIDLDLLSFSERQSNDPNLVLPHPRICERLFVLLPILELNSEIALPGLGPLKAILDHKMLSGIFEDQQIYKLGEFL